MAAAARDGREEQRDAPQLGCAQQTSSSAHRSLSGAMGRAVPGRWWFGERWGAGPCTPGSSSSPTGRTPGASSSTGTNTAGREKINRGSFSKPHLFKNKKLRGNEKTKALLSLVLSSRGNETSKAPIQSGVGGREIPLQTHLSEQLLKWKCRSSETFKFPPLAREEEGGRGASSHAHPNGGPFRAEGICRGVNQDRHTVLILRSQLEGASDLEGREGNE